MPKGKKAKRATSKKRVAKKVKVEEKPPDSEMQMVEQRQLESKAPTEEAAVPGRLSAPYPMAEVATMFGGLQHIRILLQKAFQCVDRVLLRVPWGDYVIFRRQKCSLVDYFLFDGCLCNPMRFRYYDLEAGTHGLKHLKSGQDVLKHVMSKVEGSRRKGCSNRKGEVKAEDICKALKLR